MTKLPMVNLPRAVPEQQWRAPQKNIPALREQREAIKKLIKGYVQQHSLVPPLTMTELREKSLELAKANNIHELFVDYVGVLLNNEVWSESLAKVPYGRRLLLLPKCLRVEEHCPAPFDEFGLLCKQCGLCNIQDLQEEAERLGYAVLVAEGSALVMAMIETGQIEAIVGVSCLSVLEKAFPYTESAAIPCLAIPLLQDDCKDTNVDEEWVWDAIHLTSDDQSRRMDLDGLKGDVQKIFEAEELARLMGPANDETTKIGQQWLAQDGKRWRPFLTVCAYSALTKSDSETTLQLTDSVKKIAIAVECFHKASLIHDDIEDDDATRYGQATLHEQYGVAIALNVGDLLLGEGYRLIAEAGVSPAITARLLSLAANGHRALCLGQGAELSWVRNPEVLKSLQVLEIFRQKTAPAFEIALSMGAVLAGADDSILQVLKKYSEALGIAYQIRDDLDDLHVNFDAQDSNGEAAPHAPNDISSLRPTLPIALATERARGEHKAMFAKYWARNPEVLSDLDEIRNAIDQYGVIDRSRQLMEAYKEEAIRSLATLEEASLKGLLRRVMSKIFKLEIQGWCSEFETRNAANSPTLAESAG